MSQYRLEESTAPEAKVYTLYGQNELYEDLVGLKGDAADRKQVRTLGSVAVVKEGDLIFSTISGEATIVSSEHDGYIFTQNYVVMNRLNTPVDKKYIAYLINESKQVKRQLQQNLQGSQVIRYSLSLLKEIELPTLPPIEVQERIGDIYFKQKRIQALQIHRADLESKKVLALLEGVK